MLAQISADYFARSPLLMLPVLALGIFFLVFLGISVRTALLGREDLQRMASLPLVGEEVTRHD